MIINLRDWRPTFAMSIDIKTRKVTNMSTHAGYHEEREMVFTVCKSLTVLYLWA